MSPIIDFSKLQKGVYWTSNLRITEGGSMGLELISDNPQWYDFWRLISSLIAIASKWLCFITFDVGLFFLGWVLNQAYFI